MTTLEVRDKKGELINVGDTVSVKRRGGKRTGKVTDIVTTTEEAEQKGVKNPPKVLFEDQHGHTVSHKPGTLVHGDDPRKS